MPFPGGAIVLSFKHENTIDYLKKERKHERTNSGISLGNGRFDRRILELRETTKEDDSADVCGPSRCGLGMAFSYEALSKLDLGVVDLGPTKHVVLGSSHDQASTSSLGYKAALKAIAAKT